MYLGSWTIDDYVTFPCNTHDPSTGAAADADSVPTYRVYEDETGTPILTGSMALLDAANTVGFYSERIQLTAGNGLEKGKSYTIYVSATVNSVVGTMSHCLQIEAEVDASVVSDKTGYALSAAGVDAILDDVVEGTETVRGMLRIIVGFVSGLCSGGGTASIAYRDMADTKDRIVLTVDGDGDRSVSTVDGS